MIALSLEFFFSNSISTFRHSDSGKTLATADSIFVSCTGVSIKSLFFASHFIAAKYMGSNNLINLIIFHDRGQYGSSRFMKLLLPGGTYLNPKKSYFFRLMIVEKNLVRTRNVGAHLHIARIQNQAMYLPVI